MELTDEKVEFFRGLVRMKAGALLEGINEVKERRQKIASAGNIPQDKIKAYEKYVQKTEALEKWVARQREFVTLAWECAYGAKRMMEMKELDQAVTVFADDIRDIITPEGEILDTTKFNPKFAELWKTSLTNLILVNTK